jgi:ornithine--oxo-acid transaminase
MNVPPHSSWPQTRDAPDDDQRAAMPSYDIAALAAAREEERYSLHSKHLNEMWVRVLKTIGYDVGFTRGSGAYLFDRKGDRYLDLLSGWGVFAIGRNHPALREAIVSTLDAELPNLVQLDVSTLAGILAERLLEHAPWLDKVFFANSGTEAIEAAVKLARGSSGRPNIVHCSHSFHGLTYGALSMNGDEIFKKGFGPLMPGAVEIPFDDLEALDRALSKRDVAAFFVEPIQGKGVNIPKDDYLAGAAALCRKYGTLFVADEIQTGVGRTGKFLAIDHYGVEPDMVVLAKALSGGHVPIGAVLTRKRVFDKVFDRMDRAVVHGSTFSKNDLAMTVGIATLDVLKNERIIENAAACGERLLASFRKMAEGYELLAGVRGKGPAYQHPAVSRSQGADAGRGSWQSHDQTPAAPDAQQRGLRLDRKILRRSYRGRASSAFRGLVPWKNAR